MDIIQSILKEISEVTTNIEEKEIEKMVDWITPNRRIFVIGAGRNGLQGRAFAMRLMHIGYTSYYVGDTITPAIKKDDILIAISGSGNTESIYYVCQKAIKAGAKVLSLTTQPESLIGEVSECVVRIPSGTRQSKESTSIQLLSTLFDQSIHILFDSIALRLAHRDNTGNEFAKKMHSNLE